MGKNTVHPTLELAHRVNGIMRGDIPARVLNEEDEKFLKQIKVCSSRPVAEIINTAYKKAKEQNVRNF